MSAGHLPDLLRAQPPVLAPERIAWLADQACSRFHPAAQSDPTLADLPTP
jgi:hypothetical protein